MKFIRLLCSVLFVLAGTALSPPVRAGETTNVAVLSTSDELRVQTFAELTDIGYTPSRVDDPAPFITPEKCREIMAVHQAGALLQITAGEGVSIWLYSPEKDQAVLQERLTIGADGQDDSSLILRAVEMLRALMLAKEVLNAPPETAPARVPAAVLASAPAPAPGPVVPKDYRAHRVSFAGGPAISYGFSELPPTLQIWLQFQVHLVGRFHLGMSGLVPTVAMSWENEFGTVDARSGMIALFARIDLLKPEHRVCPFVEIGGGVQILSASGQGAGDYSDNSDTIAAALIYGRLGVDISLNRRVALFVAARVGAALPEQSVQAGENIPFGNPIIGGSLGVSVGIF